MIHSVTLLIVILVVMLRKMPGLVVKGLIGIRNGRVTRIFTSDSGDNAKRAYKTLSSSDITRHGSDANYAATWQAKGDYYLSFENLDRLNRELTNYEANRSRKQRMETLKEVSLTYFARFHNLIRKEYQFEKKMVQERIRKWGKNRLRQEGFALFDMRPTPRGALFQDQIVRFDMGRDAKLPQHKFSVGDSVRITPAGGDPLSADEGIDGVVLGKGKKYMDLCVRIADMSLVDKRRRYRLDDYVNRVSYDRMLQALQLFLRTEVSGPDGSTTSPLLSRSLRDLMLYSYPNSITRLSVGGGGLRLGMPVDERLVRQRVLEGFSSIPRRTRADGQRVPGDVTLPRDGHIGQVSGLEEDASEQQQSQPQAERNSRNGDATVSSALMDAERRIGLRDPFAVADDTDKDTGNEWKRSDQKLTAQLVQMAVDEANAFGDGDGDDDYAWTGIGASPYAGVFRTNERLSRMSSRLPSPTAFHQRQFDDAEIARALQSVLMRGRISISSSLPEGFDAWNPVLTKQPRLPNLDWAEEEDKGEDVDEDRRSDAVQAHAAFLRFLRDVSEGDTVGGPSPGAHSTLGAEAVDFLAVRVQGDWRRSSAAAKQRRRPNVMNDSQKKALTAAIQRPISLIQGPPGTGKTLTACNILSTLIQLKNNRLSEGGVRARGFKTYKALAVAHSNVATDNLLSGLLELDVKVVRIGRPSSVRTALWAYTLDARLQMEPMWIAAKERVDVARQRLEDEQGRGTPDGIDFARSHVQQALKRLARVEKTAATAVLREADVVVSTCVGAGGELLKGFTDTEDFAFSTVLVDEAAQCVETAVLPALVHKADQLVLVGDQNQLPPVVMCPEAANDGLGVSLFARLVASGMDTLLLETQYRMHPRIAEFSSRRFYDDRLSHGVSAEDRVRPQLPKTGPWMWPHATEPVALFDTAALATVVSGDMEATGSSSDTSFLNRMEASCVVKLVQAFLDADGDLTLNDIGVISPYAAQVRHLTERFREEGLMENPSAEAEVASALSQVESNMQNGGDTHTGVLEVKSVDGFQGREKEVIIISTVRSNAQRQMGFLKDWRRLNVGITRARRGLIVLGDSETLASDPHWRDFVQWTATLGAQRVLQMVDVSVDDVLDSVIQQKEENA